MPLLHYTLPKHDCNNKRSVVLAFNIGISVHGTRFLETGLKTAKEKLDQICVILEKF
jgi:hypothetical protein